MIPIIDARLLTEVLFFSIGFLVGESFAKFDYQVQKTIWFKQLTPFKKWLVRSLLDALHHFQYGLILMLLAYYIYPFNLPLYCLGFGLVASDLRNFEWVVKRLKQFPSTKLP